MASKPKANVKTADFRTGTKAVLARDGGVVTAVEAARLYGRSKTASVANVLEAARQGRVISVSDGDNIRFPIWQFRPDGKGGVLDGLVDVLEILRNHPAYDEFLPLAFLSNPRARLGGKTALEVLRSGDVEGIGWVKRIAQEYTEST